MSDLFLTPQQYAEWYARERAAVIEECAMVAEVYPPPAGRYIAAAIRALAAPQSKLSGD